MRKIAELTVKILVHTLARCPFWLLYLLSDFLYVVLYRLGAYRTKTVRNNLNRAFPQKTAIEKNRIEKAFYKHLFDLLVEGIKVANISEKQLCTRCTVSNPEIFDQYYEKGQNIIVVIGHCGNWEWASGSVNLQIKHQLQTLYQPIKSELANNLILDIRSRFGTVLIERKKALRELLKASPTELVATNFLADQSPYELQKAEWVDFFHTSTPFFNGYAAIARKIKAPILFSKIVKTKRGHYEIITETLVEQPADCSNAEIVARFANALENQIEQQPFNWLWSHKRWKRAHLSPQANQ
ncbi:lipid A biosynthesis acyltransferase [bacterium]|nr:lipid A biosynthesis acyltransferase [bacterium]